MRKSGGTHSGNWPVPFQEIRHSQYVGKINITIDEQNNIVGTFDKILRIHSKLSGDLGMEKIPLLSEAQVMVKVITGMVTEENPLGLYINAVINYEPR